MFFFHFGQYFSAQVFAKYINIVGEMRSWNYKINLKASSNKYL